MPRRILVLVVLLLALAPVGAAVSATPSGGVEVATLDTRIERAQRRIDRWYERIERWYARIDRASVRVERLEVMVARNSDASTVVLRPTTPRHLEPAFMLKEATRDLRRILTDPWARHVQSELDTWNAYLFELLRARERALRPVTEVPQDRPRDEEESSGLDPGQPVTYEGWAGEFLRHLGAPACQENLLIVVTWETAESTTAAFNPLATTRDMAEATDMNSVGVKHYVSLRQGLDASRDTLLLGAESYLYGAIVDGLRACDSAEVTARAINASAWCRGCVGGAYITGQLPIVRTSYDEHAGRFVSTMG